MRTVPFACTVRVVATSGGMVEYRCVLIILGELSVIRPGMTMMPV